MRWVALCRVTEEEWCIVIKDSRHNGVAMLTPPQSFHETMKSLFRMLSLGAKD